MKLSIARVFAFLGLLLVSSLSFAGSAGSTEFEDIVDTLTAYATGSLGKTIAIGMFIVGIGAGIMKQSIISVVAGLAAAMVMNYGPGVIENIFTAVI